MLPNENAAEVTLPTAVDPSASVIGPSLAEWGDYPGQWNASSHQFDMVTFLDFAVANNIKLAAISWHEIADNLGPNPTENAVLPVNLADHVAEARAKLKADVTAFMKAAIGG